MRFDRRSAESGEVVRLAVVNTANQFASGSPILRYSIETSLLRLAPPPSAGDPVALFTSPVQTEGEMDSGLGGSLPTRSRPALGVLPMHIRTGWLFVLGMTLVTSWGVESGLMTARCDDEPQRQPDTTAAGGPAAAEANKPMVADEHRLFFEEQVAPLLKKHCYKCHGEGEVRGGLRLTARSSILQGGDTGPAVSLTEPGKSLLLAALNYDGYEMPPSGKLPAEQIAIFRRWVELGLPGIQEKASAPPAAHRGPPAVTEEAKQFWSFQPPRRPSVPEVKAAEWVRNPIDAFVLQKLEQAGLQPNPPASKIEWLRRAYYDLIGLPPTPEEVAAFIEDDSADAYERVVDQLLQSPHYGERWGRHWLDLVRYAETNSYERDGPKPFVWRYRDYVIRSLNADKPYNQFVREQLAGDELWPGSPDALIATGFYRLGIWQDEPVDHEQEFFEDLDDLVRTTGEVYLGLTVGCARCHDHKLDPLPQRDYYRLSAFFRNIRRFGVRSHESVLEASVRSLGTVDEVRQERRQRDAYRQAVDANRKELDAFDERIKADLKGVENDEWKTETARIGLTKLRVGKLITEEEFARYVALTEKRNELRNNRPRGLEQALCITEQGRQAPPSYVLVRGNAHVRAEEVAPGFPSVLSPPEPQITLPPEGIESTGRRSALAHWITDRANPLTARVMVNRIWQFHFGRGLVRTPSDFGFAGSAPTHPELLDWLAVDFMEGGWTWKRMHKLIMLSNTYQLSSRNQSAAAEKDPVNDLFWRFDMRRLSAEEIRDSVLAVNGSLNRKKMFGPSIFVEIPAEVMAGQSRPGEGWGNSSPEDRNRRSVYIHIKRSLVVPMLASFDGADTDTSCPVRFVTTQPTQALGLLNSPFAQQEADVFRQYLQREAGNEPARQVELALRRVLQRPPTAEEIERGVQLIDKLQTEQSLSANIALKYFCLAALNLNEFVYLD